MLHDPSHKTPPPVEKAIKLSQKEKDILKCYQWGQHLKLEINQQQKS
jgi:hypothetical protein